jgi:hypothetical protein
VVLRVSRNQVLKFFKPKSGSSASIQEIDKAECEGWAKPEPKQKTRLQKIITLQHHEDNEDKPLPSLNGAAVLARDTAVMTYRTIAKWKNRLNTWIDAYTITKRNESRNGKGRTRTLKGRVLTTFTLTLPSQQMHDDQVIKRNILGRWVKEWLVPVANVRVWFIKCEIQPSTGNIHFHGIADNFLPKVELLQTWLEYCGKLGYDITSQAATRVDKLNISGNMENYLVNYLTKQGNDDTECRNVVGRWFLASDSLRDFEPLEIVYDRSITSTLDTLGNIEKLEKDYFTIWRAKVEKVLKDGQTIYKRPSITGTIKEHLPSLYKALEVYYSELVQLVYNGGETRQEKII